MKTTFSSLLILMGVFNFSATSWAAQPTKTILISDIDDTIKDTQVRPSDLSMDAAASRYWHLMTSILSANNSFIGIPLVYTALAANGVEIHYVTGNIEFLGSLPEKFLQSSGFPEGQLWLRPNLSIKTEEFKVAQIQKIMLSESTASFIMIGDNGEKDVSVYRRLKADPRFKNRIIEVYIHHVYSNEIGERPTSEQKLFLTAADLSVQLLKSGALTEAQTQQVLKTVEQGLTSQFESIQRRTFPPFANLDPRDLSELQRTESQIQNPTLRALFQKIKHLLWKMGLKN